MLVCRTKSKIHFQGIRVVIPVRSREIHQIVIKWENVDPKSDPEKSKQSGPQKPSAGYKLRGFNNSRPLSSCRTWCPLVRFLDPRLVGQPDETSLWQKDQPSLILKESPQDSPPVHQHWKVSGHCQVAGLESLWQSHNWSHGKSVKLRLRHFQTEYSTRWILCFELSNEIDEIFLKMLLACLKSYCPNRKVSKQ